MTKHLFRPFVYFDNGTDIDWKYASDCYFESEEEVKEYMEEEGYCDDEYKIEGFDFDENELADIKIY